MNKDTSKLVTIPGELHSAATGNIVAGADEIFDYDSSCYQSDINSRWQYIDNPEYVEVHVDASSKVLYGVKQDGDFYFGAGVPSQVESRISQVESDLGTDLEETKAELRHDIDELQDTIEYYVDASINELGERIDIADASINRIESFFDEVENPEFVEVHVDASNKILYGVKEDGDFYFGAGVPSQIEERIGGIEQEISQDIDASINKLDASVDNINKKLNRLNIGIDPDRGVLRIGNKMFKLIDYTGPAEFDEDIDYTIFIEATTTLENPEWQQAITDSEDRLLYGKKQGSGEEYWPQQELEGYTMTVDGVTASVNSIIRNIK